MKKLFFILGIICWSNLTLAQQTTLSEIENELKAKSLLEESVFIHTDKDLYVAGETIWLKAYIFNSSTHRLQDISSTVYAELISDENIPVWQTRLKAVKGAGAGSFFIPYNFASGNYKLRGYTYWMTQTPGNFFEQKITIVNTLQKLEKDAFRIEKPELKLIPEGGNLTAGIANKIIFNYNAEDNYSGLLLNDNGDTVLSFNPEFKGTGAFNFIPDTGQKYLVRITDSEGNTFEKALPAPQRSGYGLSVNDNGNNIQIRAENAGKGNAPVFLIIKNGGDISYAATMQPDNGNAVLQLDKSQLRDGVSEILLYNNQKRKVYNRWFYKPSNTANEINLITDRKEYGNRNKVQLDISTLSGGSTTTADLSVAVYRKPEVAYSVSDIISYLETGLTGLTPNGNTFLKSHPEVVNYLKVLTGNITPHTAQTTGVPELDGQLAVVKVTNRQTGLAAANIPVYISVLGSIPQTEFNLSDDKGMVYFRLKDLYGHKQLLLTTEDSVREKVELSLLKSFVPTVHNAALISRPLSEDLAPALSRMHNNVVLENDFHSKGIFFASPAPLPDSTPFYGAPYNSYLLDNYKRFTTMEEVLREYVTEVNVRIRQKDYNFQILNRQYNDLGKYMSIDYMMLNANPLVLLDGVPIFNMNKIIEYDPLKVRKLDIVADRYHLGKKSVDGILAFTTYNRNFEGYELNPNDVVVDYTGWQDRKGFPEADYSSTENLRSRMPDFRQLLYWAPSVTIGDSGNKELSFYTGDEKGTFVAVVQGISGDGRPLIKTVEFEVK
ncbi:MAG: hypothetical protein J5I50_05325 [Chitinophagaceae bacterium]|nr:hypothetical protein [Chitinophagaceae bacterium]